MFDFILVLTLLYLFWQRSKDWKANLFKDLGEIKPKGINRIAKIGQGHLCPREEKLSFISNAFQSFDLERTWWRLIQKRVVRTKFDIYVLLTHVPSHVFVCKGYQFCHFIGFWCLILYLFWHCCREEKLSFISNYIIKTSCKGTN
jgi:hypothetical protein